MQRSLTLRAVLAAAALSATSAWPMWLGRVGTLPVAGQPLDATLALVPERPGEAPPACVGADVFYGDVRQPPPSVTAEIVATPTGAQVRVRAAEPVTEALVHAFLHLGCQDRYTRRVTLVTQPAPAVAAPATLAAPAPPRAPAGAAGPGPGPSAGLPSAAPAAPAAAPVPRARSSAPSVRANPAAPAAGQAVAATPSPPAPAPRVAAPSGRAPAPAGASQDRLRLSTAAAASGFPVLRLSTELRSRPSEQPGPREAAAALWRALNATPEEVLHEARQLEALRREVAALRAASAASAPARPEASARPEVPRTDAAAPAEAPPRSVEAPPPAAPRPVPPVATAVPPPPPAASGPGGLTLDPATWARQAMGWARWIVLAVAAALLLGFVLAWLLRRRRSPRPARSVLEDDALSTGAHLSALDIEESLPAEQGDQLRWLKAVELQDVQQEAGYFAASGQPDRAIEVLRAHLARRPDTSVVAWLALLDLLHRTGKREAFDAVRRDLQRQAGAGVPDFDAYVEDEGPGLEGYPKTLTRVVRLWPSREALALLEESIFQPPGRSARASFSLQAYREMLLLHQVGSEVLDRADDLGDGAARPAPPDVIRTGDGTVDFDLEDGRR